MLSLRYGYLCGKPHRVPGQPSIVRRIERLHKSPIPGERLRELATLPTESAAYDAKAVRGYRAITGQAPVVTQCATRHKVTLGVAIRPKMRSPDKINMRQLRIKIMNAPAAVIPMTIMAATAKNKYAVGRSSPSATSGPL
jgi:hypothetical protein